MSEATPADQRPEAAEPRGEAADSSASNAPAGPRRNRRRGSRGGRSRGRGGGASTREAATAPAGGEAPAGDDRRPDLPDRPGEGRASADAAARALIPKPKIGDSRPAPEAEEGADDGSSPARKRRRRGGRGRGTGGRQATS